MIILSVLIATTQDRKEITQSLIDRLEVQREFIHRNWLSGHVEIVVDDSKRFLDGGLSIGKKREALVQRAQGRYLCFLDSDEDIAGNYLQTIVKLSETKADVLTFRSLANLDDFWCLIDMSLDNKENEQANPGKICKRMPWHVCAVKSHLAKIHQFEDSNYGEDWTWFEKVLKGCTSEAKSDAIIHMYKHRRELSEADKITNHELQSIK